MQRSFLNSLWQSFTDGTNKHDEDNESSPSQTDREPAISETQEHSEGDVTPRSSPSKTTQEVPSFSLSTDEPSQDVVNTDTTISSIKATSSDTLQTTKKPSQASTPRATPKTSSSSLMPPPSMKAPTKSLPTSDGSLRIPSNGPLPNRGPPANSQQRAGSSGRGKVLLAPGHSPMDWASLARSKNLSGVPALQRVTPSQMKVMNGRKGNPIWSSYQGKVYNVTPYLPFHPGGEKELMKAAGRDGTKLFMEIHPWVNWEGMLSSCLVGILVSEEEAKSSLDSLD
ncbi:hypothetical protein MRB53_040640 [Persea americana]|nr:hypothetical protein MRB53_040640 [Persea americana]